MATIQYRVAKGKKEEVVEGPEDADVVVSVAASDIEMGANVAFMRGKLKAAGHSGVLLRAPRARRSGPTCARQPEVAS